MTFTARSKGRSNGALLLATPLMFAMLTTTSHAYTPEQAQRCSGDAMRLCGAEIPDVDRITACMVRKRAQLSEGCKAVFHVEHSDRTRSVSYDEDRPRSRGHGYWGWGD